MRIITISREFGSGGRELGKRLADQLGYDYYDNEIISMIAEKCDMDETYVEKTLGSHIWKTCNLNFRSTIASSVYAQAEKVHFLVQEKSVIEGIAALGRDCVIVGRNADLILKEYHPFRIFVCAEKEAKLLRCKERASAEENLTDRELLRKMKEIDQVRSQTREILSDSVWGDRDAYDLTINTTGWNIKKLVPAVADFAQSWFGRES